MQTPSRSRHPSVPEPREPDPRVGVVVATRDRVQELLTTLEHLVSLDEQPRIVVVDNASSDGTEAAVRARFGDRVELLALDENLGGAARNLGVARLGTPYVAFADDDSWWAAGALRRAADLLDEHPRLALINGLILVGPEERVDPICEEMARSPLPAVAGQPGHPLLSFLGCAAVVRREAFEAVGGFSLRLRIGGEEEILGYDLAAAGWTQSYVPDVVVHHHPSTNRDAHERRMLGIRNTLWTTWLRRPVRPALRRTVRLLAGLPRDLVTVRGLALAAGGLPWLVRERRVSPPHVEHMRALLDDQQHRSTARRYVS